jgi:transcriptional regulator with XRE-family HTH domain
LDLGLLQREVALRIGVDKTTVFNWEAGTATPNLRALAAVIRFLGYDPQLAPEAADLGRLVRHHRQRQGLSMDALAEVLGVDSSTVRGWEQHGHRPGPRLCVQLAGVLGLPAATVAAEATTGQRLRVARLRAGLTQRELGGRIGVEQQVVSDWETGRKKPVGKDRARINETIGMASPWERGSCPVPPVARLQIEFAQESSVVVSRVHPGSLRV